MKLKYSSMGRRSLVDGSQAGQLEHRLPTRFDGEVRSALAVVLVLTGCSGVIGSVAESRTDSGVASIDAGQRDAGEAAARDAGGPVDAGPPPCPKAPPFDAKDADLVARCTEPVFVASGGRNRRVVSQDGLTWAETFIPAASISPGENQDLLGEGSVTIGNGIIALVGGNGVFYSKNGGRTFEESNITHQGFDLYGSGMGFLDGTFWLNAYNGTWSSKDGATWVGQTGDSQLVGFSTLTEDGGLPAGWHGHGHGTAAGDHRIVFTNDDARYRMFDGTRWYESRVGNYGGFASGITYGAAGFLMIGTSCCNIPEPTMYGLRALSRNGIDWVITNNETDGGLRVSDLGTTIWDGSRYYTPSGPWIGDIYTSVNGLDWEQSSNRMNLGGIAIEGGVWVAISHDFIMRSTDRGATWTRVFSSEGENIENWFGSIGAGRVLKRSQ